MHTSAPPARVLFTLFALPPRLTGFMAAPAWKIVKDYYASVNAKKAAAPAAAATVAVAAAPAVAAAAPVKV